MSTNATEVVESAADGAIPGFVRVPILDRRRTLFAYELQSRDIHGGEASLTAPTAAILEVFSNEQFLRLANHARTLVRCNREVLLEHADKLPDGGEMGIIVGQDIGFDEDTLTALEGLANRGVLIMMDGLTRRAGVSPEVATRIAALLRHVRYVALDSRKIDRGTVSDALHRLHALGIQVIATHVDDHPVFGACEQLGFDGYQGNYLYKPEGLDVEQLKANKLNVLRLLAAIQDPANGPVELETLIRNDAVLSYKLLNCVNSAYFNLPRKLKSLQHAAIFFGVARIRNWVYAMSLGGLDDSPPELLKLALVRARMCELLAQGRPNSVQEQAFITGLFSLLDTLMNAPMHYVLEQVPVADEIRQALVDDAGPLAPLLGQVRAWETGYVVSVKTDAGRTMDLAELYLQAAEWADEVYSFAGGQAD
ncbi:HDOD domain-containing protein [Oleiagrimonas sp. C23AA]|uniref:EAL and HDOD domain-containing protein n=1 Tax=Oleiagrimonas sp. C23AA TaxID=2719047 RepID=UPI001423E5C9|nr:HDOD domain-containing protein [Oleiagrimonas sp. C23AA]NII09220.1 HDOD domain-containing protein [Oleiagrimonas sp. C23AA]